MVNFERDRFFDNLEEMAKKTMQKWQVDHVPTFFVVDEEGDVTVVQMPLEEKEKEMEMLRSIVDRVGSSLYYSVMCGWQVNANKIKEEARKAVQSGDVARLAALQESPSKSPLREEVMIVAEYDQHVGMRIKVIPYRKEGDRFIFREKAPSTKGTSYNRFNIWTPVQFDGGGDEDG